MFFQLAFYWFHNNGFLFCNTFLYAVAAAIAVHYRNTKRIFILVYIFALTVHNFIALRCIVRFFFCQQEWANSCVWANKRTAVTLNTIFWNPAWYINGYAAFFVSSSSLWEGAVLASNKSANRKQIALLRINRHCHIFNKVWQIFHIMMNMFAIQFGPSSRNFHLTHFFHTSINCVYVHLNNCIATMTIGFNSLSFHSRNSHIYRNNIWKLKESSLQNSINATSQAYLSSKINTIYNIKFYIALCNFAFHVVRKFFLNFGVVPNAVKQESTAILKIR